MDPMLAEIRSTLIQAHGETLGGLIYGAYRLAETAVAIDQERRRVEAQLAGQKPRPRKQQPKPTPLHGETGTA